jgi:hypothetical protein
MATRLHGSSKSGNSTAETAQLLSETKSCNLAPAQRVTSGYQPPTFDHHQSSHLVRCNRPQRRQCSGIVALNWGRQESQNTRRNEFLPNFVEPRLRELPFYRRRGTAQGAETTGITAAVGRVSTGKTLPLLCQIIPGRAIAWFSAPISKWEHRPKDFLEILHLRRLFLTFQLWSRLKIGPLLC